MRCASNKSRNVDHAMVLFCPPTSDCLQFILSWVNKVKPTVLFFIAIISSGVKKTEGYVSLSKKMILSVVTMTATMMMPKMVTQIPRFSLTLSWCSRKLTVSSSVTVPASVTLDQV